MSRGSIATTGAIILVLLFTAVVCLFLGKWSVSAGLIGSALLIRSVVRCILDANDQLP